jgi:hypothetical protein
MMKNAVRYIVAVAIFAAGYAVAQSNTPVAVHPCYHGTITQGAPNSAPLGSGLYFRFR